MISQKSQNGQNKCFFRGPLFVLKTTTTTNFTQLTILVASVGRFDLLYFLNDWSYGLRLTTFCYDSRSLTREKRTEKKHEKKIQKQLSNIHVRYNKCTFCSHSVAEEHRKTALKVRSFLPDSYGTFSVEVTSTENLWLPWSGLGPG